MLVLHCENLQSREGATRQSGRFTYRMMPPWMEFSLSDHDRRLTWTMSNSQFNTQSRSTLESLQPSRAWVSNVGMRAHGVFRIIEPTTVTPGIPTALEMNVQISWGPEFVNITTEVDGNHLLFSVRPPEGTRNGWRESRSPLPLPVFLRSDGTRMTDPPRSQQEARVSNHPGTTEPAPPVVVISNQAPPSNEEPSSSSNAVLIQSPPGVENRDVIPPGALSELQSNFQAINQINESITPEGGYVESQDFPAVQIIDQVVATGPFAPLIVGDIPFSRPPQGGTSHEEREVDQRPITIEQVTTGGTESFDERMQMVRQINHARLANDYGTHSGARDFRVQMGRTRIELRPQITITPAEARFVIPPPPLSPKPPPPTPPPPMFPRRPPATNFTSDADRTRRLTLLRLNEHFHPPLRLVTELRPNQLVNSIITRTGQVHPPFRN